MAQVTMTACDQCRATPAEAWLLTPPTGKPVTVDLCHDCGSSLRSLVKQGRPPVTTGGRQRFRKTKSVLLEHPEKAL